LSLSNRAESPLRGAAHALGFDLPQTPEDLYASLEWAARYASALQIFLDGKATPLERAILRLRFGLSGENPKTLEETGDLYDLSKERTRQLQNRALARFRDYLWSLNILETAPDL